MRVCVYLYAMLNFGTVLDILGVKKCRDTEFSLALKFTVRSELIFIFVK